MNRERHDPPLVCIVDDDDTIRRALTRLVESLGLRACAFAGPRELLDRRPWDDPSCLLLDVQLPDMSGFELYDLILEGGCEVPVVFVTGEPRPDTRSKAARVNAVACLDKPFREADVVAAIREALAV